MSHCGRLCTQNVLVISISKRTHLSLTDWHVRNASVHLQKVVIGHPRDRALITQEIGARMANHNRGFCYSYDYQYNHMTRTALRSS